MKFEEMDYETYQKFLEMRKSSEINNRRVKSHKKNDEIDYKKAGHITAVALLMIMLSLTVWYSSTKSKMQGIKIEPRTGFTYGEIEYNPTFEEVVEEMFNFGKGK